MNFELDTYDLQDIVIALICNDSGVLKEKETRVKELIHLFAELNRMTEERNDWTLCFTATQKEIAS